MIRSATTPPMASTPSSSALAAAGNTTLSLQVSSPDDLQRLARLFSASGLFGRSGNPDAHMAECAIKILAGMEAGFGPFASAAGVSVINGRPGFGANLLAQAIKRHPQYDYRVLEKTDQICRIKFLSGKEELGIETFTIQMAERANLIGKGGPWKQYPEAMLFARCLSAGMRTHCPDALGGAPAYTPEELGAQGPIDENGMVTVTVSEASPQRPAMLTTTEELVGGAQRAAFSSGLTPEGLEAFCRQVSQGKTSMLAELPNHMLARLANKGVTAETVAACNAAGASAPAPEPVPVDVVTEDSSNDDPSDDPDDLPAAWAA
jgi:hypothetical protein